MTPLARRLATRIAAEGPMRLDAFIADCLLDPHHGYYATRDPFGRAGDFITAPEISQMFGELLGLALGQFWRDSGAPDPVLLVEAGPGRGTLMADMIRAMRAVPGLAPALRLHLIEASPALRAVQRATLAGQAVTWHDSLASLPDGPMLFVANEFLDALPIRQFRRVAQGWAERRVGLDAAGALAFGLAPPTRLAALERRIADTRPGDVVETCAPAVSFVADLAARLTAQGGAAILVDYGGWHSLGDTFQALKDHAPCDPLAAPGQADLTAHVDFEPLAQAAQAAGARFSGLIAQGDLLARLGIAARSARLAAGLSGAALEAHQAATRRLTHPDEMGHLFKALALAAPWGPLPPGFDAAAAEG